MPDELVKKTTLWQRYAHELGYQYQLITEGGGTGLTPSIIDLIETLNINMQPENITLIKQQYDKQDFHSVADILRYEIINHFGGIYVDVDFEPPTFNERNIDWFSFASKHDLTCFSEHHSREVYNSIHKYFSIINKNKKINRYLVLEVIFV
jgi:mannosyltransferase OCH1-like enzyme